MSLSDLASLGSFISGFAVLVSLIFLYFQLRQVTEQVRQAEKNQRASIRAVRATRIIDIFLASTDPTAADAYWLGLAADRTMTDTQIRQFAQQSTARFFNAEDSFYQHRQGLLDDYAFINLTKGLRESMSWPGMRVAYAQLRHWYGDEFVAHVDRILEDNASIAHDDMTQSWRSGFAAEQASMSGSAT